MHLTISVPKASYLAPKEPCTDRHRTSRHFSSFAGTLQSLVCGGLWRLQSRSVNTCLQTRDFTQNQTFTRKGIGRSSGRTVTDVARELGISSECLRGWVKKARAAEAPPVAERDADGRDEELQRLRKLTAEQAKTIEILKKRP
ncbi:transposase [Streptomyces sp. NPDC051664]|uniref:transposase n=1 Tax=Streptomyces sp. NPDC051664 TaxID=3365668 RepID=UPI0037B477A1